MLISDLSNPLDNIKTVRPLAKTLYKSLFSSSELFGQIRDKLGLLVAVLDATEEHTQGFHAGIEQIPGLKEALGNCYSALDDLSRLKDHFDGVTPQTQVTWERMGWADHELVDLSSKITTYINGLNVLNANMIRSSHENVERLLKDFMNDICTGKRKSSDMSSVSTGSLSTDEKEQWRQLRKELQSIGITPDIFTQNREFILNTLRALSQSEIGCLRVNLAPVEEEKFSPGSSGYVADDSSELESQGDVMLLPQIRPNDTIDTATQPHASSNQAPREEQSDE
ncbi:hypothetical protein N7486_010147 [Penicillium sp. IBT 16267x]|nr:hypothetical protein N7486_010147 [Penicillium sp. IBT 16267x]